jgi:hypothetical protein
VEDPFLSCPRSARTAVIAADGDEAYAVFGVDVPGEVTRFRWELAVQRISFENPETFHTVGTINWRHQDATCQIFVQLKDDGNIGRVHLFAQGDDGTGYDTFASFSIGMPHPTLGQWSRLAVELDLGAEPAVLLDAEGEVDVRDVLAPCAGPADDHTSVDMGPFYTTTPQVTAFDDVVFRYIEP